jgi:nucleobase:cation symporter-1, NCS1 family
VEQWSAPLLIALSALLFGWAVSIPGGGLAATLAAPSAFAVGGAKAGLFWASALPALSASPAWCR